MRLKKNREYWFFLHERYCNRNRTHKHIARKRTPNYLTKLVSLAKWLSYRLRTKLLWVRFLLQSLNVTTQILRLFWARSSLAFGQLQSVNLLYMRKWHEITIQWTYRICQEVWLEKIKIAIHCFREDNTFD